MLTMVSYACERHNRCQRHTKSLSQVYLATRGFMDTFLCDQSSGKLVRDKHIPPQPKCQIPPHHKLLGIPTHSLHSYTLLGILSHFHAVTCTLVPSAHSHALLDIPKHSQGIPCTSVLSQAPSYTPGHSPTFSCCHLYSYTIPCPLCTGVCLRI